MDLPDKRSMESIAEHWRPYRTLGTWYMWHVLEMKEAAYTCTSLSKNVRYLVLAFDEVVSCI